MNDFLTDEVTGSLLKKLNVCYGPFNQWEKRKARKVHTDLFGTRIMTGEYYYRLRIDQNFSNDLKFSSENMERFLYALFVHRPSWETEAENEIQRQLDKAREIINKLW
jgi:hypothetical protein